MKKFTSIILVLFLASACVQSPAKNTPAVKITLYDKIIFVGSTKLNVQIVSSNTDMEKGLSGRNKMADNEGMLFDFKKLNRPAFWMKDMNFNLDLIWIRSNKIIGITPNVPAPVGNWKLPVGRSFSGSGEIGNLPAYSPPSEVDMVLEVNAGWSERNNIKTGDVVKTNEE